MAAEASETGRLQRYNEGDTPRGKYSEAAFKIQAPDFFTLGRVVYVLRELSSDGPRFYRFLVIRHGSDYWEGLPIVTEPLDDSPDYSIVYTQRWGPTFSRTPGWSVGENRPILNDYHVVVLTAHNLPRPALLSYREQQIEYSRKVIGVGKVGPMYIEDVLNHYRFLSARFSPRGPPTELRANTLLARRNGGKPAFESDLDVFSRPGMPKPRPKPEFSTEDDTLLAELKDLHKIEWDEIAIFFPGRSLVALKERYYTPRSRRLLSNADNVSRTTDERFNGQHEQFPSPSISPVLPPHNYTLVLRRNSGNSKHRAKRSILFPKNESEIILGETTLEENPSFQASQLKFENHDSDGISDDARSLSSDFSQASSMIGIASAIVPGGIADDFVKIFCSSSKLREFIGSELTHKTMDVEYIQRNVRRLIQRLGKDLSGAAKTEAELEAAKLLRSKTVSHRVTAAICSPMRRMVIFKDGNDSFDDKDSNSTRAEMGQVKSFITRSQSYLQFQGRLLNLFQKPYRKRIQAALGHNILSQSGASLDKDAIYAVSFEISCVPSSLLKIHEAERISASDCIKGWIEDHMGETWDWWPLQCRRLPLRDGYCRLAWRSPSGLHEFIDMPSDRTSKFRAAFESGARFDGYKCEHGKGEYQTPATSSTSPNNSVTSTTHITRGTLSQPKGTLTGPNQGPTSNQHHFNVNQASPQRNLHVPGPLPAQQNPRHVYLCIKSSSDDFEMVPIRTDPMKTDTEFFAKLKSEYLQKRGIFQRWFSVWRYSHCDFFAFQKYGINMITPIREGFPPESEPNYEFTPRPLSPQLLPPYGPIHRQEFRAWFYKTCHPCPTWHKHRLRHYQLDSGANAALQYLPKHKIALDQRNVTRTEFWGLYAREQRSFAWVLAYGLLCNAPGIIFFFLWLFVWGHGSDLQNAVVPSTLSLSLTLTYLACLYASSEGSRQ